MNPVQAEGFLLNGERNFAENVHVIGDGDAINKKLPPVGKSVSGKNVFKWTYDGVPITVMGSGMGMPSMGIYSFELFHFFDVQKIIRIGTCGAVSPKANINDMLLSEVCLSSIDKTTSLYFESTTVAIAVALLFILLATWIRPKASISSPNTSYSFGILERTLSKSM